MKNTVLSVQHYRFAIRADRVEESEKLRQTFLHNTYGLFEEMGYAMIGRVVTHSIFLAGYHCNPKLPLPFISIASQKNSNNFYHICL